MSNDIYEEIARLNFEDLLWIIFIILSLLNIYGDYNDKEYLKTRDFRYKDRSNKIFTFTIEITFLIYIYFFIRNYKAYQKASDYNKRIYLIKLLGSSFLIAGIICLLYFQKHQSSFVGSPAL